MTVFVNCCCYESSGYIWNHGRDPADGAEYSVKTNELCPICEGRGYVEVPSQPVTLEDLEDMA